MFKSYDEKRDDLLICGSCGVILHRKTVEENAESHSWAECPVCRVKMDIELLQFD